MPLINPNGVATLDVTANENVIDGVHYQLEMSKTLAENIFIKLRTRNQQAVTGKYIPNGTKAGVVMINRVKKVGGKPRTLAGTNNAGTLNNAGLLNVNAKKIVQTDQYFVPLLHLYDVVVAVPRTATNLLPVDLVNAQVANLAGEIQEMIDSSTLAVMVAGACRYNDTLGALAADKISGMIELPATGIDYHEAIIDAIKLLLKGDKTNGIGQFTPSTILARVDFAFNLLKRDNGVIVGGANYAQEMIAKGVVSPEQAYLEWGEGTMGMVNGVPVVFVPDQLWDLVKLWLSVTSGSYANNAAANVTFIDAIQAITADYIATARGIADEELRVTPSSEAQATNLLPLWQWGVEALYGTGIVLIIDNGTTNPYNATTNQMNVVGWDVA